jgi:ligand-binding sensor domain-containing protein
VYKRGVPRLTFAALLALVLALLTPSGARLQDAENSGLFYSEDEGESWTHLATGPPVGSVYALWLDPLQPGRIVVATELSLWLSEDDGENWQPVAEEVSAEDGGLIAYSLASDPEAPERLWAGTEVGVLHSQDGGASWFPMGEPGTPAVALLAVPGPDGTLLFAGTSEGLRVSLDDGQSWEPDDAGLEGGVLALGSAPEGDLLVGTTAGVFVRPPEGGDFEAARGLARGPARLVTVADDGAVYAAVGSTLYRRDEGWTKQGSLPLAGNGDPPVISGLLLTGDDRLLIGSDHGLHSSAEWKLVPPFDQLGDLETAPLARDYHRPERIYVAASALPHQSGLARAGIQFEAETSQPTDDRMAALILLLFVVGGFLAARYLGRRGPEPGEAASAEPPAGTAPPV